MLGVAVCLECNALVGPSAQGSSKKKRSSASSADCPHCRGKLDRSVNAFEIWEKRRLKERIDKWHADGLINDEARANVLAATPPQLSPSQKAAGAPAAADAATTTKTDDQRHALEKQADDLFASTSTFFSQMKTNWGTVVTRIEADSPPPVIENDADANAAEANRRSSAEGIEAGRAVFGGGHVIGAGVDALSELDEQNQNENANANENERARQQPMGALQVFWFIGAVLVLAGSLMGVREAWRSLEGVLRPLVIAGALFAYHVAFVVLSRMLARRSETTGRVLGVIAVGLAPIAFVAVAVAAGMSRSVGIGSAAILLAATAGTSLLVGGVFGNGSKGVGIGIASGLLPCLALEVPLGGQENPLTRVLVPIAALTPLAVGALRARVRPSPQVLASLAAAAYGAVVVAVYALAGGPSQDPLDPTTFGAPLLATVAWVGLATALAWFAMASFTDTQENMPVGLARLLPRASPVLRVITLSVLVSAALTGSANAIGAGRTQLVSHGVLAFAPALVAALATIALFLEARRHSLALHFAIPIAHFAVLLVAFVAIDRGTDALSAPYWVAATALVPALLMLASPLVFKTKALRIGSFIWSIASSIIVTAITSGVEPSITLPDGTSTPLAVTAAVAGALAIAAHVGGRTVRPSQHYLGAVMAIIAACAWFIPSRLESGWFTFVMILDGVALVYGVLALGYGAVASASSSTLRPFDDVSLIAATLCVYFGWAVLGPTPGVIPTSRGLEQDALGALVPTAIAAAILALRAFRDRSRLVTLHAGLGIGVAFQLGALALANGTSIATLARASLSATRVGNTNTAPSVLFQATGTANLAAQSTLVAGLTALLLVIPATLRAPAAEGEPRYGRPLFGFIPFPLGASGRTVLDGYGLAAIVFAGLGSLRAIQWISTGTYLTPQRDLVVIGLAAIIVGVLATFLTRALDFVRARGHVGTLIAGGVVIALTAVSYRIGRPLPPAVVGWRLTLVLFGVWLLSRLFVWKGPWVATKLERPSHGTLYHFVPHAGVLALGGLLLVDALFVGGPTWTRALVLTPPTLLGGGALAMLLLYRSFGLRVFLHVGLAALLFFACFVAAQQHVLGPDLEPLDPPGGRWMLPGSVLAVRTIEQSQQGSSRFITFLSTAWLDPSVYLPNGMTTLRLADRAILGTTIFTLASSLLLVLVTRVPAAMRFVAQTLLGRKDDASEVSGDLSEEHIEHALLIWTCAGACLGSAALAWQPSLMAGGVLVLAAVIALASRTHAARALAIAVALPMFIHSLAHTEATSWALASGTQATFLSSSLTLSPSLLPLWGGPALAALALVVVAAGAALSKRSENGRDPQLLMATQGIAIPYGVFAIEYAMATRGTMQATASFWRVLDLAQASTDGSFAQTQSLAASFGLLTITSAIAAWSWRGAIARMVSVIPPLVLGSTAATFSAAFVYTTANDVLPRTVTRDGPLVGAAFAVSAAIAHVAGIMLQSRQREDAAWGTRIGRDVLLVAASTAMAIFVTNNEPGGREIATLGMVALGLPIAVAIHAITREQSSRHVYFVEVLVVALYAFATRAMNLRPEIDAMLGLGYGFTLLGVAVLARRQGLAPVANATRRFLGALPLIVAFLTMRDGTTNTAAMFAVGSSVLYGVVAVTEHNRAFGSLAAVAANIALIVFALAQGLDGIEVWLGPIGLLVAAVSQIFAAKLSASARSAVRITGGALLYLPSGMKLALRLGAAEDATYSVVFGAVCLLGVVIGVVLKVRAYLALATFSLTLDVVANLAYAGLRDHRLGFVILSTSGLLILGIMIMVTLRRERARAFVGNVRSQLSGWD